MPPTEIDYKCYNGNANKEDDEKYGPALFERVRGWVVGWYICEPLPNIRSSCGKKIDLVIAAPVLN